ncbi:MAG: SAM-dependent methyltransferase [Candidatus Komeilibacteria bacterium CG_4_10_14_0_2_um_filter_37_10]|uniref:SAM-dependent methyltransferase n=1 Tax=Candidatus Komeilibacteria bacterium CG_4_10_14_0_2_um_filter_37_10 TaxID=1974470 RepID=A0A2M7VED8_9BACT|nr:MAG: SAM-dependent methyltransferase [Candidatus Komeilibacteria bacterium CG_4_10_14_0_2_um_filter_37_10]PJA92718.1 MAG: SAM-dependent methyltransferase [Candidatus Komeilibacteria bacterium CG_4_9_14_3_um_filter_37_5]
MSIINQISGFNRKRKWNIFNKLFKLTTQTTILDVGFNEQEYSPWDNYLEKKYPYPNKITALGIAGGSLFKKRYSQVNVVLYNGDRFPFFDKEFDICWSNAVLEHVGNREQQLLFLQEVKRVARTAFITTPNKYFPIEIHTRTPLLHFLPQRIFFSYLSLIGKGWATGSYMNLLSMKDLKSLLAAAGIERYQIIQNKLLFFTLDFVIIIKEDN